MKYAHSISEIKIHGRFSNIPNLENTHQRSARNLRAGENREHSVETETELIYYSKYVLLKLFNKE